MMSSAFTNPSSGKIDQQRKILEELERRKKDIKHSTGTTSSIGCTTTSTTEGAQVSNNQQRAAMEVAQKTSYGYFIPQDSSFGNFILPVIPRLNPPTTTPNNSEKQ